MQKIELPRIKCVVVTVCLNRSCLIHSHHVTHLRGAIEQRDLVAKMFSTLIKRERTKLTMH